MLVQDKAYLLLLMCLSIKWVAFSPAQMAVLVEAAEEQAMACLNIRLEIRAIHYGLASRIAQVVGRGLPPTMNTDTKAAMAALMAATATHREVIKYHLPLAALAAVTVAAMGATALLRTVEMQHIMVRVAAVAYILNMPTVVQGKALAAAAIKA